MWEHPRYPLRPLRAIARRAALRYAAAAGATPDYRGRSARAFSAYRLVQAPANVAGSSGAFSKALMATRRRPGGRISARRQPRFTAGGAKRSRVSLSREAAPNVPRSFRFGIVSM